MPRRRDVKNLIRGVGSILAIAPKSKVNLADHGAIRSDSDTLRDDWYRIGRDMSSAVGKITNHARADEQQKQAKVTK